MRKANMKFSEFLKEELDARRWTVRDLAIGMSEKEIGINHLAVEMLMACEDEPGVILGEMAEQLGNAFDVSPEFISNLWNSCHSQPPAPTPEKERGKP